MKKFLLLAVSMLLTSSLFAADLYLRGAVTSWAAQDAFKFTTTDGKIYTLEKEFDLYGEFKFADASWGADNYGSAANPGTVALDTEFGLSNGSLTNFNCGSNTFSVKKIVLDMENLTGTIYGSSGELVISSWTLVGDEALVGVDWDPAATENDLAFVGGVYQITKTGVTLAADGLYQYKFAANHAWGIKEFPASGNEELVVPSDGVYDIVFALNPSTGEYGADAKLSTAADEAQANAAEVVGIYNMIGQPVSAQTPGLKIFVYSNGTTEKKY